MIMLYHRFISYMSGHVNKTPLVVTTLIRPRRQTLLCSKENHIIHADTMKIIWKTSQLIKWKIVFF